MTSANPPPPGVVAGELRGIADRIESWVKYDPDPSVFAKVARQIREAAARLDADKARLESVEAELARLREAKT